MNALVMADSLQQYGLILVFKQLTQNVVKNLYIRGGRALRHILKKVALYFGAGIGSPYFQIQQLPFVLLKLKQKLF